MLVTLEYLEKSLKQNLAAVLWIDSSLLIFNKVGDPKQTQHIQ